MKALLAVLLVAAGLVRALPAAAAESAAVDITGNWEVTERDPLFPDNPLFGQFSYRMTVERTDSGYLLQVPRTGARFADARLDGNRLKASGSDPTRGEARLELTFKDDSFSGSARYSGQTRTIEGRLSPEDLLARRQGAETAAAGQLARSEAELAALRHRNDLLSATVGEQKQALAAANGRIQGLEQELMKARAALKTLPDPVRPAPASVQTAPPALSASRNELRLQLIEPPLPRGEHPEIGVPDLPMAEIVGKVDGPSGLLSLRVNGIAVTTRPNGLFSAPVNLTGGPTPVVIVAIDLDGRRAVLDFSLKPTGSQTAVSASGTPTVPTGKAAASQAATCYQLVIAAERPEPSDLEACRKAVQQEPEKALNHYNLGVAFSRLGRHDEALLSFREAAARWSR